MKLSEELLARGFVYQFSGDSLASVLDSDEKRTVYLGIDPTADSIHVGNLVPYILLKHFMDAGHQVILLFGGATALIGDPSGKDTEREFVDAALVAERAEIMKGKVLKLTSADSMIVVNNYDWLSKMSILAFLRDVGKHFTVNALIKKESVERRLESENGISFTEFSYSLLQGYDFYHLSEKYDCTIQIGGSDQWGNIIAGVDYVRRMTGKEVYGLTMPLIVDKTTGKKFGKSAGNAVWLDPEKTSPYAFYQFWLNVNDESVGEYLKMFTFLPLDSIDELMKEHDVDRGKRVAQRKLAEEVTKFVHGAKTVASVESVTNVLFGEGDIALLGLDDREMLVQNAPCTTVSVGSAVIDVLVESGLAGSKREARTFIESGAVSIGGSKITSIEAVVEDGWFTHNMALMNRGKKNRCVLVKA